MTTTTSTPAPVSASGGLISQTFALVYGTDVYTIFLGAFLYALGFTGRFIAPKHINSGLAGPPLYALTVNLVLLALFAIRHSGMARRVLKRMLTHDEFRFAKSARPPQCVIPAIGVQSTPFFERLWAGIQYSRALTARSQALRRTGCLGLRGHDGVSRVKLITQ